MDAVRELIRQQGSIVAAAQVAGVSERHMQKWVSGHSSPSEHSMILVRVALDGDRLELRNQRIKTYTRRIQNGKSPFPDSHPR